MDNHRVNYKLRKDNKIMFTINVLIIDDLIYKNIENRLYIVAVKLYTISIWKVLPY